VPVGRPRAFDFEKALDRALDVFWRKGYEGTSMSDLTEAMGINRPSLYAAYGNKEELFRKALDRYAAGPAAFMREALGERTARAVVERILRGCADMQTNSCHPPGCLVVHGALACGETADPIRQELIARRVAGETALCQRLECAKLDGDLPADADAADLARYVSTIVQGLAVQAAAGATRKELEPVIQMALRAWPKAKPAQKAARRKRR
jgi:AcrR family transcriptional regulator